ncbi:MAG: PD-(D/E)XK nuclease family protein, partial [Bacteroidota bacterium]
QTSVYRSTKMLVKIWHRLSVNLTKGIYYKDLLMWLSQPDLKLLFKEELLAKINSTISYKRWIYIRDKEWLQLISEFPETQFFFELFTSHNFDFKQALNRLDSWLNSLSESKEFDDLSVEAIFRMQNTVIKMQEHADQNSFLNAVENIDLLFQHYTASEEVTFQGEPLQGIQILSPQETRGVNFRNCIIVGANDDVFPGSGRINSLIPFDLRIPFKLPLPQDKEGAVAYTFYRLIQRAEKTRLIYYTLSSDYKSTEPSRYILQIKHELADKKWNTILVEEDFIHENQMTEKAETIIQANDFSKERIRKLLENGISPSALNKFLACPLDFYYRYVIGLGELEELEENMEAATLGIVVHKVMEVFFKEFEQKEVNAAILKSFIPRIDHELDKAITEKYTKGNELSGFDIITKGVAKKMIENVINYDIDYLTEKNIKTKVEGVEVPLQAPLPLDKIGRKEKVLLKGLADRIDLEVGKFKIIDFKTGKVEDKHVTFSDSDERWVTSEKTKLVQLLAYTYMWFKGGHAPENITATLFGLKQARKGYFPLKRGKDTAVMNAQDMQRFETEVMDVIVEMLEISEFKHNEEAKYCEFCNQ